MTDTRYAIYCRNCKHLEDKAWEPATAESHSKRTDRPLSPQGHVPIYCVKCGARNWERPATKEHVDEHDAAIRREARAIELTQRDDFDGMFKIPDELRASAEVRRALSNLLGPLDGDVLRAAQANVLKVSRSGMSADALVWIEWYDKAVQKAMPAKKVAA